MPSAHPATQSAGRNNRERSTVVAGVAPALVCKLIAASKVAGCAADHRHGEPATNGTPAALVAAVSIACVTPATSTRTCVGRCLRVPATASTSSSGGESPFAGPTASVVPSLVRVKPARSRDGAHQHHPPPGGCAKSLSNRIRRQAIPACTDPATNARIHASATMATCRRPSEPVLRYGCLPAPKDLRAQTYGRHSARCRRSGSVSVTSLPSPAAMPSSESAAGQSVRRLRPERTTRSPASNSAHSTSLLASGGASKYTRRMDIVAGFYSTPNVIRRSAIPRRATRRPSSTA